MDAFELLKTDHQKVSALFKEIEAATQQSKKDLFLQLKNELDVHAHIEETIFYPALADREDAREITLEAYEEHKVVKDLLAELEDGNADEEWTAKLTVLRENVEHHVEEEEGELFDKAEVALGDEEIERLGDEMAAEKARQRGAPQRARRAAATKASSKTEPAATRKSGKKSGILTTLANLVGLGSSESTSSRKTAKAGAKKPTKKAATKKAGKKQPAKKAGAKRGAKKPANKNATVRSRTTAQKTNRSAASKKSASRKSAKKTNRSRAVKSGGATKRARKR